MSSLATRGTVTRMMMILAVFLALTPAEALEISNRYRSPRSAERKIRPSTDFIILHTTEAPARSSLNKVSERGECHYCVTEEGTVYRIVDRDREAFHAGRSMWNGRTDIDKYSIGIECVGYHNRQMPLVQLYAIRDLVKELKSLYRLRDDQVMSHSMVAYGEPNKWQKYRHRGRKRCGMLFAMPSVRRVLDLKTRVRVDPDTTAKRLAVGDPYLQKVLYGNVDTMRAAYANVPVRSPVKPSSGGIFGWFRKADPAPPPPVPPTPASTRRPPGGARTSRARAPTSIAELKAQGYTIRGVIQKGGRTASGIAGSRWNSATTYYTIRNKVIPGNAINPAKIEVGMAIWMK
ncbi:MAG: N-acetylmuramoyl-L-alanine amidase [Kiritimatiellia bacterium]